MKVSVVGCSGSAPGPQSPASCYLVQAQHEGRQWSIVLDLGNGSLGPLQSFLDPRALDAVVLSHLHPDHCLDVCSLYVVLNYAPGQPRAQRLPVYAPAGGAERLGRAYGVEGPESLGSRMSFNVISARESFAVGPFQITPIPVYHPVEAYGLRVEADGQVLAYTGDTDYCPQLAELCAGADLVLADCAFVDGRDEAKGIHMSGSKVARAAIEAGGVRRLMLTHIPAWNDPQICHDQAAQVWPGEVELAVAGAVYDLAQ
ncbi:MBL fold metallo-hydrolase [Gephyromycinifex aptenodytis]|uniref:MBL fold metallo-hydrolase n=1 Tax=Gephyromycinifex aptenodytis TaxID=2716227 RepID=UPI001447155A|nr:MBL fold metallo-hydrolase [Gephyromycinifex aptenodytis]